MPVRYPPARRRHSHREDVSTVGLLYPPDRVRIAAVCGDPLDRTRALITFDRPVAGVPINILMWVGDRHANGPMMINPRVCRVSFGYPLYPGDPWTFDPAYGSFGGTDHSGPALAAAGTLADVTGPIPAGKIYLANVNRVDEYTVDFAFSGPVTAGANDPSGFWADDENGVQTPAVGTAQQDGQTVRVSFPSIISEHSHAGLFPGFAGVDEAADVLTPTQWRF